LKNEANFRTFALLKLQDGWARYMSENESGLTPSGIHYFDVRLSMTANSQGRIEEKEKVNQQKLRQVKALIHHAVYKCNL